MIELKSPPRVSFSRAAWPVTRSMSAVDWGRPTHMESSRQVELSIQLDLAYDDDPQDRELIGQLHQAIRDVLLRTSAVTELARPDAIHKASGRGTVLWYHDLMASQFHVGQCIRAGGTTWIVTGIEYAKTLMDPPQLKPGVGLVVKKVEQ